MFKNWDKDTDVDFKDSIISDIKRCSIVNKLGADSQKVQEQLLMLLVFYCVSTEIKFTQGMVDIMIPFLLLESKYFPLP